MAASDSERDFRDQVAIVGIGYSRSPEFPGGFSRNSGVSVLTLAVRAAREACADAGIDPKELEGGVCYGINDTLSPQDVPPEPWLSRDQLLLLPLRRRELLLHVGGTLWRTCRCRGTPAWAACTGP